MTSHYQAVGWNGQKKRYDFTLIACLATYFALFVPIALWRHPDMTAETMIIRSFGLAAFLLLHVILAIGPLCRLNDAFLPLLYNRRHLGVTMFLLAFVHGTLSFIQFHVLGDINPFVSLLTSEWHYLAYGWVPFQPLGAAALFILFLMAATSHDFWLANLSAPTWKALHMGVYFAYFLMIAHVGFGILQSEVHPWWAFGFGSGFSLILTLHLIAGWRERRHDQPSELADDWIRVGLVDEIPMNRARIVCGSGERIAVFRYDNKISAVSNVCQHQNGPLGEGRVIDGCITCPWHGYQYLPENGQSPPPFTEKIPTFQVRVDANIVWVNAQPLPAGTHVSPVEIEP